MVFVDEYGVGIRRPQYVFVGESLHKGFPTVWYLHQSVSRCAKVQIALFVVICIPYRHPFVKCREVELRLFHCFCRHVIFHYPVETNDVHGPFVFLQEANGRSARQSVVLFFHHFVVFTQFVSCDNRLVTASPKESLCVDVHAAVKVFRCVVKLLHVVVYAVGTVSYAKKSVASGSYQKSLWVFLKRRHTRLNVVRKDVAFETVGVVVVA